MSEQRQKKRLLYGGTFDPIHSAHLRIALAARELVGADRVSLVPAADPPHKPDGAHASAPHRLAMVRLVAAQHPELDVLDMEILRGGTSYTIATIEQLQWEECRGEDLMLLIGQDSVPLLPTWHRIRELAALVPFAVAPRPGAPEPDWTALEDALGAEAARGLRKRWLPTPQEHVSSTDVRRRIAEGRPIRCWVPDAVADYIAEHGLYGPVAPASTAASEEPSGESA